MNNFKNLLCIFVVLAGFNFNTSYASNNVENISQLEQVNLIENFESLDLFYENKGKANYIISAYAANEEQQNNFTDNKLADILEIFENKKDPKEFIFYFRKINLNFYIDDSYESASYSNMEDKGIRSCFVNIKYNNNFNGLFFNSFKKDIKFIFNHELSHCFLGKEIFSNKDFWKYDIDNSMKNLLSKIIAKKTIENVSMFGNKTFYNGPLPLVVYHEMFADTFTSLLLYREQDFSLSDIKFLRDKRLSDYEDLGTDPKSSYISFRPLSDVIQLIEEEEQSGLLKNKFRSISNEEIKNISELYSQKYFIEYLLN